MVDQGWARSIRAKIRGVLGREWDPIGVGDEPAAADAFDVCIGGVLRLLVAGASAVEIAAHLREIELRRTGRAARPRVDARASAAARRLLELDLNLPARVDWTGMTVNERLHAAGWSTDFEEAARSRDRDTMIALLIGTGLPSPSAEGSVDTILADPLRYGFPPV